MIAGMMQNVDTMADFAPVYASAKTASRTASETPSLKPRRRLFRAQGSDSSGQTNAGRNDRRGRIM
jgi:hypothetical protein